jgi:hypothetical protein
VRSLAVDPVSGDLYAARFSDLMRSTDGGSTWTPLGANTGMANIYDV